LRRRQRHHLGCDTKQPSRDAGLVAEFVVPAQHDQKDIVQEILSVEAWAGQPASPAFDCGA